MVTTNDVIARGSVRFGTSGARGLVSALTDDVCYAYARAFVAAIGAAPGTRVAVGMDLRPSSPRIVGACLAALRDAGMVADFCATLPTPALAYHAQEHGMPALMVTGSHIPFDRNGIKFYRPTGEITKADETAILAAAAAMPDEVRVEPLPAVNVEAASLYAHRYLDCFPGRPLAGMRVGFYEHSSLAREALRDILEGLGATVLSLGRTDEFVPIDTEAVAQEDFERARAWAADVGFDAIVSTDGDADRPLIGDENGAWLRGDVVGILCAGFLGADAVATPVSSNTALERCGRFARVARTRIGSPYVIAGMEALSAAGAKRVVGYEANGGFLVGSDIALGEGVLRPLPTRDAVLPIVVLLNMARSRGVPVSRLAGDLPPRFTASDRLREIPVETSRERLARLASSTEARAGLLSDLCGEVVAQDETDGLRWTCGNGEIVHLRPSGNAPELRCYAEADSQARAESLAGQCLARFGELPEGGR